MLKTLFENMKAKVELFDNEGFDVLTIKGKEIQLGNIVVSKYSNPSEHLLTDYVRLYIDDKQFESCGETILISSTKLKETYLDSPYIIDADDLMSYIKSSKSYHRKPYWVIIKSQTGNVISVYNCRSVQTQIMPDFPKMTKIYIDDDILYVHRANINIIDSKLIK